MPIVEPSTAVEQRTETERLAEARSRYVARGISTPPLFVARAEGARIVDVEGREYIDFAGGLACQNTGHGFPPVVVAIHEQVDRYLHQCAMVGMYEPYLEVCRRLAELSPCGAGEQKSLLVSSGAEAVENAVKIARAATGRPAVLVFGNSFHGRTLLTLAMTGKIDYKRGFGPFPSEVYRAPGPYPYRGIGTEEALPIWSIVIGHATFCVVVYNNVLARLRRTTPSLFEASADLGADGWQTFRYVTWPVLSTALVAGALLAFALSFDEVIVTTFTAGAQTTLPIWILDNLR